MEWAIRLINVNGPTRSMIHVAFKGRTFWVHPEAFERNGESPLAPEDHVVDGKLTEPFGISFAHLYEDGTIIRYGQLVGYRHDLERIE